MLDVTVRCTVHQPEFQTFTSRVILPAYSDLTPQAARAALSVAFGRPYGGEVWGTSHGYRVYPRSIRKLYQRW